MADDRQLPRLQLMRQVHPIVRQRPSGLVAAFAGVTTLIAVGCSDSGRVPADQDTADPHPAEAAAPPSMPSATTPADRSDEQPFDNRMAYFFSRSARGPTLSFGVPQTDNVALTLRCPAGAAGKTVLLYFMRPAEIAAEGPDSLVLAAGESQQRLRVRTDQTQLGTRIEAQTEPASGPMKAYREGKTLEVHYGAQTITLPSRPSDTGISSFFDACSV